ncbi:MAG: hypothetical protein Q7O66_02775 [Dehalococcoidia bacterium]|nr:hypothetical protein [Dehalococcoidia bacterium]
MDNLSRREALKTLIVAAGAIGAAAVPTLWEKPSVQASSLNPAVGPSTTPTPLPD